MRRAPLLRIGLVVTNLLANLLAGACSTSVPAAGSDLAVSPGSDLAAAVDMAVAADLAVARDLVAPADLVAPPDLAVVDLSQSGAPDLAGFSQSPQAAIRCGGAACKAPSSVCCRPSPYGDGRCVAPGGACGDATWFCDDPADCGPGSVCCQVEGGSTCLSENECNQRMGRRMCLAAGDCRNGEECCGVGPSPEFFCGQLCPISRRARKTDIAYLDPDAIRALHRAALDEPLPAASPARPDGNEVYARATRAAAALRVQSGELSRLDADQRALRAAIAKKKARTKR